MTVDSESLGSFGDLAKAVGLLDPSGSANSSWFGDPIGAGNGAGNQHGLRHVLADNDQRDALLSFVDEVLGPPDRAQRAGQAWVPLFAEPDPQVTISAVVQEVDGQVRVGVGLEHTTAAGPPRVTTRVHVPVLRVAQRGQSLPPDGVALPDWLLLGRAGGRVEVSIDATFTDTPPVPGAASLAGTSVTVGVPTSGDDDLSIALELRDLQLPGATAPRTFSLDATGVAELGTDVLDLVTGLVRAQADALDLTRPELRAFAAVAGLLGLRDVPGVPPLPLAAVPTQGIDALVTWVEGVLSENTSRDAWLGQLAGLVGGSLDAAGDAVSVQLGPARVAAGLRVRPGTAGHPVLVPFVELSLDTRSGVRARLYADLLRADTGSGVVRALPDARLEAVFGADAGGAALLPGADPRVGSLHTGVALDATGRPAFVLTLHDVTAGGRTHPLLDLSSPQAAVDSASSVVEGALATAIGQLGPAGALVNALIGLEPPAGVAPLDVTALLANPLAAVLGYWNELTNRPAATADVLGRLRALVTGAPVAPVPGSGTGASPWRVELAGAVALLAWRQDQLLACDVAWSTTTPVLGDYAATAAAGLTVLRVDLAAGHVAFATQARGGLSLARADGTTARLALGAVTLEARSLAATVRWTPANGLRATLDADSLAVTVAARSARPGVPDRIPLALPTLDSTGRLALPAMDWAALERLLAGLLAELRLPVVDALVDLAGWNGGGAHLDLVGLMTGDPVATVRAWLAGLLLDCRRVRYALGPAAALLSGFRLGAPMGSGSPRSPYRCPVAGEARMPGLAVWLDPGCPPEPSTFAAALGGLRGPEPPESSTVVAVLHEAATTLPDVAGLLVGRDSLASGFDALVARWAGTDGLVGRPASLPDRVTALDLPLTYDELVALGSVGMLTGEVFETEPAAVVHVGCEPTWSRTGGAIPATGAGTWFVRLPTPGAAALARPDRGGVGEQAAQLAAALAGRTEPVTVLAYGACGAAALRAAATVPAVSSVVTVGSPWSDVAVEALHSGLGGDALRLLDRLRPPGRAAWPDPLVAKEATPSERALYLVRRAAAYVSGDLPPAAAEALRSGLDVRAVFGSLDEDSLQLGLGAFVADGIRARLAAAQAAPGAGAEPTALHAGVDLPVIDLDLGGLLVGAGATVELCRVASDLEVAAARGIVVEVHLGVHDGWLLGGPGTSGASGDLRWMSARVEVPLDGRPGDAELVLHEARGLGVDRERWVVRAAGATTEVRLLLAGVVGRLRAASPDLAALLDHIGLSRDGGLDPDGLDRLLHDTAATMRASFAGSPAAIAGALRALVPAAGGTGSSLSWTAGPATIGVDLAAGSVTAALHLAEAPLPPIAVDVTTSPSGVSATAALGSLDPQAGGVRLVARTSPAASLAAEWAAPDAPARTLALLPTPDPVALADFATVALPAVLAHCLVNAVRGTVSSQARPALDAALDAVGLLAAPDTAGGRAVIVPMGVFQDPGGWLRHGTAAWRTNAAASAVALLDALAPLVVPDRGTAAGWPVAEGVSVGYSVESGNRLRLVVDLALAVDSVTTRVAGGLLVGPDALPSPVVDASIDIQGRGLRLVVGGTPPVQLSLVRPAPAPALPLFPDGPGLGQALSAIGETVLPPVLNEVARHRDDTASSLLKDVGRAVFDLGGALDLRDSGQFTASRLTAFAADPAAALLARLPQLVTTAVASLANALDPGHSIVAVDGPTGNVVTLGFGHGQPVRVVLDATGPVPAVELRADVLVTGVGRFTLDRLRLSTAGVDIAARLGPVVLDIGAFSLRPLLVVRAGSAAGADRMVGLGLALDDAAARSVQVRWALDATPPVLAAVHASGPAETTGDADEAAYWLLALGLSLAGGVVVEGLRDLLTPKAKACLRGVVFTDTAGSTQLDPGLARDLLDPPALLERLKRLLWNATQPPALSLTLEDTVTIGLSSLDTGGGRRALGLSVTLVPGRRFTLADGDTRVELEVDAAWVDPVVAPGLGVHVLAGTSATTLEISPAVSIAGLGLRFTKSSGPLLSLGAVGLDGIAVHLYGEVSSDGAGGGVNLELAGLAVAPGGAGGTNAVANSIVNDAGQASPASRPVFSPSLAIQQHPGLEPGVSLRAGPPPGPWWLVVQRQLGPLYLERVGFDTTETDRRVTRISLLFDGRVSLFGLTAAVDQLSVSWLGGDVLDINSWAVDLMGLAISADLSGVTLAGGILKTIGPPDDGPVSYVGMLLGRFGTYGLTVFGGYTNDNGSPSFFIFGGVNGPIGGPPAFFVTGIGGGLGINRALRIPADPSTFNEFPFIQALDPAAQPPADPMAELRRLNLYFGVERGTFWFAAGISFNCFALVDGIAVVAVAFGNGIEINLLGLARMALPRPQAALVSIELGLLARFSTSEGVFMIRAALTENSWLLYPQVRLTGGFAFVIWWKGPLAGQFVLTLGGYHPDFHRDGYPDVPRLGLTWQVSDAIVIKGGSYFALTSEALMTGVDIEVSADFGWAWARVAFGAHGIVYFDPFWFEVMAYARISAGVKIRTFLGTISISISLGARVRVWGPEFSGEATFEVGPCELTVPFGSERAVEGERLDWAGFVAKYLEDAGGGTARALSSITGRGTLPSATGGDRSAPTADGTAERPFEVYAEFELTVVTTIPATSLDLAQPAGPAALPVSRSDGMPGQLGLKPMKAGNLASSLRVRLARKDATTGAYADATGALRQMVASHAGQSYPIGAWGQPEPEGLPAPPLPQGDTLQATSSVRLEAVARSLHRGPEVDYYTVEASRRPLPLQAGGLSRATMLHDAGTVSIATPATAVEALEAAERELAGARSGLATAAYRRDVSAPPLFGTLAEGIAPVNAAAAAAARTAPPPAPPPRDTRPPVIAGYLAAGTGAAARARPTTVADRDIPRRPAPTLDSVRAQLGAQVPAALHTFQKESVAFGPTVVAYRAPRTVVPAATRSYGVAAREVAGHLPAGDVVLLTMPDAAVDRDATGDPAARRPALGVEGQARVVAMRGDGEVVLDATGRGRVPVPPGTALLAVQASPVQDDGLAGWHVRSRVCALGTHAAIASGCVITVAGMPTTPRAAVWVSAGELIAATAEILTRFSGPVQAVAIALETATAERLANVDTELIGAAAPGPPAVVLNGRQAVLVYEVVPEQDTAVAVRVRTGGEWRVTAVLGDDGPAAGLTAGILRRGVAGATGRLSGSGPGCALSWLDMKDVKEGRARDGRG